MNDTAPVGVPVAVDETVAVYVTGSPGSALEDDGVIVTLVASGLMTWTRAGEALAPKRTSPS